MTNSEKMAILDKVFDVEKPSLPDWVFADKNGRLQLNDKLFIDCFVAKHSVYYVNYKIFIGDNCVELQHFNKKIYDEIEKYIEITAQKVKSLSDTILLKATIEAPSINPNVICFKNCNLVLENGKVEQLPKQKVCLYRIPHDFIPTDKQPVLFQKFLNELFYEDDIQTVQQFLGYCLLPNTKMQKSLFIIGNGGEGKSRLTVLMKELLGQSCFVSKLHNLSERFFGTNFDNALLFIDDDLRADKFNDTENFKSFVTAETDFLVEPKGKPHFQIKPFAKFLVLGNLAVGSLYDKSEGFYRRLQIIKVKPVPENRANNPDLIIDIWKAEKAEIIFWLVFGAVSTVANNYKLHESKRSADEINKLKIDDNSALSFINETNFEFGDSFCVSSKELYNSYKEFCVDNDLYKISQQMFKQTIETQFKNHTVCYSENVLIHTKRQRGFKGIRIKY